MSRIKLNPKFKASTIQEQQSYNEQQFSQGVLTDKQLKNMLRCLSNLNKESQWELYKFLVDTKGEKYVSTTGSGTFFNFYRLNKNDQSRFHDLVMLCVENEQRKKVIEQADQEHNNHMSNLEQKFG